MSTNNSLPNAGDSFGSTKDSISYNAQAAADKVEAKVNANATTTPDAQRLNAGPIIDSIKTEANKTSEEFSNLANSKTRPSQKTATGQSLTQYHSMLYTLLSWENPRATTIAFASSVAIIFMTRYINLLMYIFKFSFFVLGITAGLEAAGRILFDSGITSSMRPRKYYTIPKESLEPLLADVEELLNFFVIETQRIVFAENLYATGAVFFSALISYFLIKIMPFWGLALLGTSVMYLVPLIYVNNREAIDSSVQNFEQMMEQQSQHIKDATAHHAGRASEVVQAYATEASHIAQQYMGHAQTQINNAVGSAQDSVNKASSSVQQSANQASASAQESVNRASANVQSSVDNASQQINAQSTPRSTVQQSDFPAVPRHDAQIIVDSTKPHESEVQPLLSH